MLITARVTALQCTQTLKPKQSYYVLNIFKYILKRSFGILLQIALQPILVGAIGNDPALISWTHGDAYMCDQAP